MISSLSKKLIPVLAIIGLLLLSPCDRGPSPESDSTAGAPTTIEINFPDGYFYDRTTHALYPPSGTLNAVLPSYVTSITLTISGEGMEPQVLPVNLQTMSVSFSITPGMRTFTLTVLTDIGLTFTGTITLEVSAGGGLNLVFNLIINAPPAIHTISADPSLAAPGDVISLACAASDLDPGDVISYQWTGPGGWGASGPLATYEIPNYGNFAFTCIADDSWGGVSSASVTVHAPAPYIPPSNMPPAGLSIAFTDPMYGVPITYFYSMMYVNITCAATDPEGDAITYALYDEVGLITTGPSATSYQLPYVGCAAPPYPPDYWDITCTAADALHAPTSKKVTLTVNTGGC